MKDAYLVAMDNFPEKHKVKKPTLAKPVKLREDEKRLIDERLEAYHKNPDSCSPWEDVLKPPLP